MCRQGEPMQTLSFENGFFVKISAGWRFDWEGERRKKMKIKQADVLLRKLHATSCLKYNFVVVEIIFKDIWLRRRKWTSKNCAFRESPSVQTFFFKYIFLN